MLELDWKRQLLWAISSTCWALSPLHRPSMRVITSALTYEGPTLSHTNLIQSLMAQELEEKNRRAPQSLQEASKRTFSLVSTGRTDSHSVPAGFGSGTLCVSLLQQAYEPADTLESGFYSSAITSTTAYYPMVPQTRYLPKSSSDHRRHVDEVNVNLQAPIYFYVNSPDGSKPGIPLRDAITSKFMRLCDRDEQLFQGCGPSIAVRLLVRTNFLLFLHICFVTTLMSTCPQWKGYQPWSRQIPTRDFRSPPGPITKAKLAKNVAKSVQRFIDVCDTRFCTFWTFLLNRQNVGTQRSRDGAWR